MGSQEPLARRRASDLARAAAAVLAVILVAFLAARTPVLAARGLPPRFVWTQLAFELVPVALLALAAASDRFAGGSRLAAAAFMLLVAQRASRWAGPIRRCRLDARSGAADLASVLSRAAVVVAARRPATQRRALYRLEDVRG